MSKIRESGIDVLGEISWGTHFCNFYETKQDLLDTLVPYFKTGLESNEFCLWVVSGLITVDEAREALGRVVPDFERRFSDKNIEILNETDWYIEDNVFNLEKVINAWHIKLKRALALGYDGMRVSGDTFWLNKKIWKDFFHYEKQLNESITDLPITVLCTYPLAKSGAADILDVVQAHQFAITRREGEWEVIESSELIQAKAEIKKLNEELEERVVERTRQLESANNELRNEIAERRKAEAMIIKEEELSNEIIDSIPGISILLDQDLRLMRWNKHFEVISGYTAEEIPLLHALDDFYDEEDKKKKREILQEIYTTGMSTYELGARMKDGRKISFYFNSRLINYEGKRCIICTGVDVTERKKFEEELKRSESRYRTLIEQASDAIMITDEYGLIIEVNKSFCKMVGYAEKELIGMDITALMDHEQIKTDPLRFDLLLEGKVLFRERLMKKKDGTVFPMEEHVKMLDDKRILAIVRDITDRRQAEDALRRSEDRIRLIINTIPIMAWSYRPDGGVDFVNQRWMDYSGLTLKEGIEDPKGIVHPEDLQGVIEKWLANMATGEPFEDEMRLRRADGEYRWFLVRNAPLHDELGNVVKWYGVSTDIEDSKRAEDELRLAYQRLSFHVENTPLAVIEFDKDLFIKRWSKRAEEIFGWKESEALGKNEHDPDFRLIYKEDIPLVDKINEELLGGIVNRNLSLNRNYTKDGKVIYIEWYNSVLKDERGNVVTILSLVHNVTERKKAEEQKEFEQREKEALINTTDDLIWSVSRDFKLIAANKAFIRIIEGFAGINFKPGDELMIDVFPGDILAFWKEVYNRALSGESFKKEVYTPSIGKVAENWTETSFNPIYKDEIVVGVACYSRNITERKFAEETLSQSYEEIRRLTEHLQKIREEERVTIAREIHDELGQQLTVLKMEVKGLNKKLNKAEDGIKQKIGDILELLDITVKSVRRISSELRPSLLHNLGLVAAMEWHLKEFEKRSGITTIFNEPNEELELPDSLKNDLFRIFQESLTNAGRHANANKINVTLELRDRRLILRIEDNGQGFEKEKITAKDTLGILGMKERSQMMGGNYEISSVPGKGTIVIVAVPYDGEK